MPDAVSKASDAPVGTGAATGFLRRLRPGKPTEDSGHPIPRSRQRDGMRDNEQQSALSHLIQGGVLIGVLVVLFMLAGFRG